MSGPWEGSTRQETLPPNWRALCAETRKAAATKEHPNGQCEKRFRSAITQKWMRCPNAGEEVDHKGDRLDHSKRQLLCKRHHTQKTQREAAAAKAARRAWGRRQPEAHPGSRGRRP